jgi:hypothetical protein
VIGGRQPEEQREHGGLHPEGDHEQHRHDRDQPLVFMGRDPPGQIGHVERAGHAVKQPDARQEQDRRDQVERDVFHPPVDLFAPPAQDEKPEGRDQHHLEPDIEVEKIAGEEGPGHPADQEIEERVIAQLFRARTDIAQGVDGDRQRGDRGDHDHHRAQIIGDQGDAERRGPAAHLPRDHARLQDPGHQQPRRGQKCDIAGHADPSPGGPSAQQKGHHPGQEGQHQRRGQQPAHRPSSRGSATRISSDCNVPSEV